MTQILRRVRDALLSRWLNVLLLAAPVSWVLHSMGAESTWVFLTTAIALIPAAGLIGIATEALADRAGPTLGGFLNATFGNAAELIIAIAALRDHHTSIVKASITGSIIGNLLLVFGLSCFVGGLRHGTQRFSKAAAGSATVMLFLAVVALVMPAIVDIVSFGSIKAHPAEIDTMSFWTSIVLLIVYGAGLIYAFRAQRDPLRGAHHKAHHDQEASGDIWWAVVLLALATLLTTVQAEMLVETIGPTLSAFNVSELFAGVIIIAFIGNAAEHYSAVSSAADNDMTLALEISVGSSAQIALLVAPALVLLSYAFGTPMSLVFNPFELTAIGLSVMAIALVAMDGESTWLEGLQLLGVYLVLGIAFYLIPG